MRSLKMIGALAFAAACFGAGLYGAPAARDAYAHWFPEPAFRTGDFSQVLSEAGNRVVLFGTSTCPYCRKTRELFAAAHVAYTDYDIESSASAQSHFKALGGVGVPLVLIGDREIRGFREDAIRDALLHLPAPNG